MDQSMVDELKKLSTKDLKEAGFDLRNQLDQMNAKNQEKVTPFQNQLILIYNILNERIKEEQGKITTEATKDEPKKDIEKKK